MITVYMILQIATSHKMFKQITLLIIFYDESWLCKYATSHTENKLEMIMVNMNNSFIFYFTAYIGKGYGK